MKLSKKQKETIAALIGEGVHTGLRKYCESKESGVAWRAIRDLPKGEWGSAVSMASNMVIDYVESGEDQS